MHFTSLVAGSALAFAGVGTCVHYTDSCDDTRLDGTVLSGHCGDNKGGAPYSSLELSGKIGNRGGVLTWGG